MLSLTRSSAIVEGPRESLSQLKSCRQLHKCKKITNGKAYSANVHSSTSI